MPMEQVAQLMTVIFGARCIDGVVLVGDRKVMYEDGRYEYREKLFCDYYPTAIGVSGSEILYSKFRPEAVKAAQELSGRDTPDNISGIVTIYPREINGENAKAILIGKYLQKLEKIVEDINKAYSSRVGEGFELLFAVQTSDAGARLHHISKTGVAGDVYNYQVIGTAEPFTRPFLRQLWDKDMQMNEFAEIAYFIIKFIEYQEIDRNVGVGPRKPQVWKIPNTGEFQLNTDDTLNELEAITHERRTRHTQFMTNLFGTEPVMDKLGYVRRGVENTTYRLETFLERIGQTGNTVRKIRLLHPDKMIERCRILFDGAPLIWDRVNSVTKTIEPGGGGNVVVPENIFRECGDVVVESAGEVIRKVNYKDLEMVMP